VLAVGGLSKIHSDRVWTSSLAGVGLRRPSLVPRQQPVRLAGQDRR